MQSSTVPEGQSRRDASQPNVSHSVGMGSPAATNATAAAVVRTDISVSSCIAGEDPIPITMADGTQLPLPLCVTNTNTNTKGSKFYRKKSKKKNYTRDELINILLSRKSDKKDKTAVVNAIHASKLYGPQSTTLYDWLSYKKGNYNVSDDITYLLRGYRVGGDEWLAKVKAISIVLGPSEDTIYDMFEYQLEIEDDEVADINNNVSVSDTTNEEQQQEECQKEEVRVVQLVTPETLPADNATATSPPPIAAEMDCCITYTNDIVTTTTTSSLQSPIPKRPPQAYNPPAPTHHQPPTNLSKSNSKKRSIAQMSEANSVDDCSDVASALRVLHNALEKGGATYDVQNFAHSVMEACTSKKSNEVEIKRYNASGQSINQRYIKVKKARTVKDDATDRSRKMWTTDRVNELEATVSTLTVDPKLKRMVLNQLANRHGYLLVDQTTSQFTASQLVSIRDHVGTGTNGMYRMKQAFEAHSDPTLKGVFFPPSIRKIISEEEKKGVVPVKFVELNCAVTKKGNRRNMCTFSWIVNPAHLLETMINRTLLDGTYQNSFLFSSLHDTIVVAAGIDKSENDLVGTWRVCNREEGNSALYVQAFACLEGPVAENYENEKNSFFNPVFPTGNFLQKLIDDHLQCLMFTVGAGSKLHNTPSNSICAIFVPIPSNTQCEKRHFEVTYLPLPINERMVQYDGSDQMEGLIPEIVIPPDQNAFDIQLVHDADDASTIVGYQVLVDEIVISTKKFNNQFELGSANPAAVDVCCKQISGHNANDLKCVLILTGQCSNSVLFPCPGCLVSKHNLGAPPVWIQIRILRNKLLLLPDVDDSLVRQLPEDALHHIGEYVGCITPDPKLRVGDRSIEKTHALFAKRTAGGKLALTSDEYRDANIESGSSFYSPLLSCHYSKQSCGLMHAPCGHINHFIAAIAKDIRDKMEEVEDDWFLGVKAAQQEINERIQKYKAGSKASAEYKELSSQSKALKTKAKKLNDRATKLEDSAKSIEAKEGDLTPDEVSQIGTIRSQVEQLKAQAAAALESRVEHAENSDFGMYNLIRAALEDLQTQLKDATSPSSKRPRSEIEFVFYKACESRAGGQFDPKQSGYEMTNGRGMTCLQNFKEVTRALLGVYSPDHPVYEWLKDRCPKYEALAKALFDVSRFIKSQKKRCPEECDDLFFTLYMAWKDTFPDKRGFNKYHVLFFEIREYIHNFHMAGRTSEESNEAFNARLAKCKDLLKRMPSTTQRVDLTNARIQGNLNGEILRDKLVIEKKIEGKKRGPQKKKNRTDNVDITSLVLDEVDFEDETFVQLTDGKLCPKRFIGYQGYYGGGKIPKAWEDALARTAPSSFNASQTAKESFVNY